MNPWSWGKYCRVKFIIYLGLAIETIIHHLCSLAQLYVDEALPLDGRNEPRGRAGIVDCFDKTMKSSLTSGERCLDKLRSYLNCTHARVLKILTFKPILYRLR